MGKSDFKPRLTLRHMKDELITKYVPSYFYQPRPSPHVQPRRSSIVKPPSTHVLRTNKMNGTRHSSRHRALISEMIRSLHNAFPNKLSSTCDFKHANDQRTPVSRPSLSTQPHEPMALPPPPTTDVKSKSVENDAKGKNTKRGFSTLSPIVQCYNCQDYGHVATDCPSPIRVVSINTCNKIRV